MDCVQAAEVFNNVMNERVVSREVLRQFIQHQCEGDLCGVGEYLRKHRCAAEGQTKSVLTFDQIIELARLVGLERNCFRGASLCEGELSLTVRATILVRFIPGYRISYELLCSSCYEKFLKGPDSDKVSFVLDGRLIPKDQTT